MKKSIKKKALVLASIFTIMASATQVFAAVDSTEILPKGTTFETFSVYVPGFNGSATTGAQTKATIGASAEIRNFFSGASGNTDVRTRSNVAGGNVYTGTWTRNLNNNGSGYYIVASPANVGSGWSQSLEFSSNITTTVSYTVSGQWRSN